MTDIAFEDRVMAAEVVTHYFWLVDFGRAAETADLFATGGTLTFGPGAPKPGTIGTDQIRAAMTARQAETHVTTRHALSNVTVSASDDGMLEVYSLLTLFRSNDETRDSTVASVADIHDRLIKEGGAWKIMSRTISPIFNRS